MPAPLPPAAITKIIVGIMLAMFLSALEQTIVAPALPTIGVHLGDIESLSWVVTAYLLSATAVTPLFGKLSDIYGRRTILLICIAIFIVGSVACALAPTMWALIAARALQGIGGGGILPIAQTIIADLVSPRERPRYQSYSAVMFMFASVVGPLLGGVLTDRIALVADLLDQPADGRGRALHHLSRPAQAAAPRAPAPARRHRRRAAGGGGGRAHAGDDLGRHALSLDVLADRSDARRLGRGLGAVRAAARECGRAADPAHRAARAGGDAHRPRRLLQHRRHHRALDLCAALSRAGARRLAFGVGSRAHLVYRGNGDRRLRRRPLARPRPALQAVADGGARRRHCEPSLCSPRRRAASPSPGFR